MLVRGAKAAVVDSEGYMLILRRSKTHPHAPLTNDLPGGVVEDGETMVEGMIRELFEETGVVANSAAVTSIAETMTANYYGKDYQIAFFEIMCQERPNVSLSYEHDAYEWVRISEATITGELLEPLLSDYKQSRSTV